MRRSVPVAVMSLLVALALATQAGATPLAPHWTQRSPASFPSARDRHPIAYDPVHGVTLVFGGISSDGITELGDTWSWDGSNWTQLSPASSPRPRDSALLAFDSTHQRMILFGGFDGTTYLGDTWAWTGVRWIKLNPAHSPSPRAGFSSLVDDPQAGVQGLLMYGGFDAAGEIADTWRWTGTDWEQLAPATSPGPLDPGLAWVPNRQRVVLFGGYDGIAWHNETWEFDGSTWTQVATPRSPPPRAGHAIAGVAGLAVVFGGFNNGTYFDDTWTYNGTAWTRGPGTGPSARSGIGMAFDQPNASLVLFGGRDLNISQYYDDTWTLGP